MAVVALAVALPWLPVGPMLGMTPLPAWWLALLAGLVVVYLTLAAWLKPLAWHGWGQDRRGA